MKKENKVCQELLVLKTVQSVLLLFKDQKRRRWKTIKLKDPALGSLVILAFLASQEKKENRVHQVLEDILGI